MSIFNITDVTAAGAFCNALKIAAESDRREDRHQATKTAQEDAAPAGRTASLERVISALRAGLNAVPLGVFARSKSA